MEDERDYGNFFGCIVSQALEDSSLDNDYLDEFVVEAFGKEAVQEHH